MQTSSRNQPQLIMWRIIKCRNVDMHRLRVSSDSLCHDVTIVTHDWPLVVTGAWHLCYLRPCLCLTCSAILLPAAAGLLALTSCVFLHASPHSQPSQRLLAPSYWSHPRLVALWLVQHWCRWWFPYGLRYYYCRYGHLKEVRPQSVSECCVARLRVWIINIVRGEEPGMIFRLVQLWGLTALVWAGADDGPGDAEFK